jgi:hypothetical protein
VDTDKAPPWMNVVPARTHGRASGRGETSASPALARSGAMHLGIRPDPGSLSSGALETACPLRRGRSGAMHLGIRSRIGSAALDAGPAIHLSMVTERDCARDGPRAARVDRGVAGGPARAPSPD